MRMMRLFAWRLPRTDALLEFSAPHTSAIGTAAMLIDASHNRVRIIRAGKIRADNIRAGNTRILRACGSFWAPTNKIREGRDSASKDKQFGSKSKFHDSDD